MGIPNISWEILNAWGFPDEFNIGSCWTPIGVIVGTNPPYAISDFLAVYPKFGAWVESISSAQPNAAAPGEGYSLNDEVSVVECPGKNGIVQVTALGSGGVPLGYSITSAGIGYVTSEGLSTIGGSGEGALVDITASGTATGPVPQIVLQMYIALASASIQQARWQEIWAFAMALYIAHFCSLYLRSEGNVGTTAGQVAVSGLERGIVVSKSAGGISSSAQLVTGLDGWGMWQETTYGVQLVSFAKSIGSLPVYLR